MREVEPCRAGMSDWTLLSIGLRYMDVAYGTTSSVLVKFVQF